MAGMPDRFDVRPANRQPSSFSIRCGRVVGQLQAALRIDDDDAFDHAGEDRLHAAAIARLFGQPAPDFLHRLVQRPRDGPELVVAEIAGAAA